MKAAFLFFLTSVLVGAILLGVGIATIAAGTDHPVRQGVVLGLGIFCLVTGPVVFALDYRAPSARARSGPTQASGGGIESISSRSRPAADR